MNAGLYLPFSSLPHLSFSSHMGFFDPSQEEELSKIFSRFFCDFIFAIFPSKMEQDISCT
jgi:hypothetical protein